MRIALVAVALVSGLGQGAGQPFAGTWAADQRGQPVVRLDLRVSNGGLVGSIQLADIHLDKNGDLESVTSQLSRATALLDVALRDTNIAFSRRDGNDTDHFEMTLLDDRTADLLFVPSEADRRELADDGIALPRPIRLTRIP